MRQALALEPNGYEANLFMGFYLQFAGESALAVEHLLLAKRLSPVESVRDIAFLAFAQFMNRNYAESVRLNTERARKFPRSTNPNVGVVWAAAYTLLERSEENRTRLYNAAKKSGVPEFPN